jgi:hypothetical protein
MERGIKVALPLPEHCQTWDQCGKWKTLESKEFMQRYGNAVLAQYTMPTDEEVKLYKRRKVETSDNDDEEEEVEEAVRQMAQSLD